MILINKLENVEEHSVVVTLCCFIDAKLLWQYAKNFWYHGNRGRVGPV